LGVLVLLNVKMAFESYKTEDAYTYELEEETTIGKRINTVILKEKHFKYINFEKLIYL
jgi:hypothetical protein